MSRRHGGGAAPVLAAALVLTGCGGVPGIPSPGAPVDRGPFTEIQADLDLEARAPGPDVLPLELAPFGHGGAYVLVSYPGETGADLIAVLPEGATFGEVRTVDLPQVVYVDDLIAARDGRVIVVGQVNPPGSSTTVFGVAVLDPETGEGPVHPLLPEGSRDNSHSVVSADGRTLHSLVAVDLGDEDLVRLLTVDLASGEITATRDVVPRPGESPFPLAIAVAPDGAVAAELLVSVEDGSPYLQLVRFGPDLEPRGEPVALTGPEDDYDPEGLAVTADGTVLALLEDLPSRIVAIAPDSAEPRVVTEPRDWLSSLIVDPSGHWAYATDVNEEPMTVDLTSGQMGPPPEPCGAGEGLVSLEGMVLSGGSLLVAGSCSGGTERLWKLGPAA